MEDITLSNWKKEFRRRIMLKGPYVNQSIADIDFQHDDFTEIERVFYTLGVWLVSRETLPDRNRCRIVEMELMSDFIAGADKALEEMEKKAKNS